MVAAAGDANLVAEVAVGDAGALGHLVERPREPAREQIRRADGREEDQEDRERHVAGEVVEEVPRRTGR